MWRGLGCDGIHLPGFRLNYRFGNAIVEGPIPREQFHQRLEPPVKFSEVERRCPDFVATWFRLHRPDLLLVHLHGCAPSLLICPSVKQ
jgi:hypothetical protein